jgi:hypothetical protein
MFASVGGPFVQAASGPLPARRTTLVPSPQHRPFDLGVPHAPQRVPAQVATTATFETAGAAPAAARRPQPPVVPVSIRSPGIVSGRGLY